MTRRQAWWLGAAVAVLAVAGILIGITLRNSRTGAGDAAASAPDVPLVTVRIGDFAERVVAQGRIGSPAGSTAKIAFPQAGIVQTIDVRAGDVVHAGQRLAVLDRA